MSGARQKIVRGALVAVTGFGCLFGNEGLVSVKLDALVSEAQAIIGRPLTPMSYAGVARRTTRRAVYGSAAVGAAAAGAYYAAPGCVQVVNAYGQIVYRCP